jgi:hypothetical protein
MRCSEEKLTRLKKKLMVLNSVRYPKACAEKPPPITNLYDCTARKRQCHQPPYRGVSCGSVQVATCRTTRRSLELAFDHETVRAARTPRHRHHLPGINGSPSESYAEIGTDRLRKRLRTLLLRVTERWMQYPSRRPIASSIMGCEDEAEQS